MNVRILSSINGSTVNYPAGSVQNVSTQAAEDLVNADFAILEGPTASGVIGTLYTNAGYTPLTPYPSGYMTNSGWVADAPSNGGFYCPDSYTIVVAFPGHRETTFDILKMRPKLT